VETTGSGQKARGRMVFKNKKLATAGSKAREIIGTLGNVGKLLSGVKTAGERTWT